MEIVRILIDAGAKLNLKTETGSTALMAAAGRARPKAVAMLLQAGADVHAVNRQKSTALIIALETHHLLKDVDKAGEVVYRVRANGDDILETVRLLVEAGADINHKNKFGDTPLERARLIAGWTEVYQPILEFLKPRK